eukprot:15470532-Alexandrium_andersonii.AAC.1
MGADEQGYALGPSPAQEVPASSAGGNPGSVPRAPLPPVPEPSITEHVRPRTPNRRSPTPARRQKQPSS